MAVREHRYRITLEHIGTPREDQPLQAPVTFEAGNHDDIVRIIGLQRDSGRFDDKDEAAAFALGLKLLSETVLKHRDDALLQQLKAPLGDFIRQLKATLPAKAEG